MKKNKYPFLLLTALSLFYEADLLLKAQPAVSIANSRVVEGNTGQRSVEVMVILSQFSSGPVTVAYTTRNGTALAGSDYTTASGTVTFTTKEIMKKITIVVKGDADIETGETFEVVLSNASGATLAKSMGTVTIVNDDLSAGGLTTYEVRFTFTGYTSFFGDIHDCPVRPNGTVVMTGLLEGREKVSPDEDITYAGTLQMDMDIDICSANTENDDTCRITVIGSGLVTADLKISFDGRGAYIKLGNALNGFTKNASGTCDKGQIDEERTIVPDKTIASVFNGMELPMLTNRTLREGRYVNKNADGEFVVEVRLVRP